MDNDLTGQFKKVDITPDAPVRLAGYFNERFSSGVLDRLYLRLAALRKGEGRQLFIQIDNCAILDEDVREIKAEIARRSPFRRHDIMVFTSHIHTGPDIAGFFGFPRDVPYLENLKKKIIEEALSLNPLGKSFVRWSRAAYEGLSFNRRWYMKNGSVMTNPPKLSPEIDRPEGAIDREVDTVAFADEAGAYQAFFINISNHTDTIGGNRISADWPGFMERNIDQFLGSDIPIFPLIAPQGNINHLEFQSVRSQTNYEEAARLGKAYADIVIRSLDMLRPVRIDQLKAGETTLSIPSLDIPDSELQKAKAILAETESSGLPAQRDMTAEDLAKGDASVERMFAKLLLRFARNKPGTYQVPLQAFELGTIAITAIPGEPFVEVGLALKAIKGYALILPVALANGYLGYIPLEESFDRGGYEIRAGAASYMSKDAAGRILAAFSKLLNPFSPEK
jgi:hypothetical protein